jgi:hypothetical protein
MSFPVESKIIIEIDCLRGSSAHLKVTDFDGTTIDIFHVLIFTNYEETHRGNLAFQMEFLDSSSKEELQAFYKALKKIQDIQNDWLSNIRIS